MMALSSGNDRKTMNDIISRELEDGWRCLIAHNWNVMEDIHTGDSLYSRIRSSFDDLNIAFAGSHKSILKMPPYVKIRLRSKPLYGDKVWLDIFYGQNMWRVIKPFDKFGTVLYNRQCFAFMKSMWCGLFNDCLCPTMLFLLLLLLRLTFRNSIRYVSFEKVTIGHTYNYTLHHLWYRLYCTDCICADLCNTQEGLT